MNSITIPQEWDKFISTSFNRVYISPASGCSANCAYCFIFDYGHPRQPKLFNVSGDEIKKWLQSQPGFRKGKEGTLISLAPSCDPFAESVIEKTLDFVRALVALGNPIQLSTKYFVSEEAAQELGKNQVSPGQIVLYGTITSFLHWKTIEPAATTPTTRLLGLLNARKYGINTCLSIKPFLPGITDKEINLFVQATQDYDVTYCAIGVMYSSESIERKLKRRGLLTEELKTVIKIKGTFPPPAHTHDKQQFAYDIATLQAVKELLSKMEALGVQCIVSGPCAVALSYGILCPTGIWRYRPHLCVNCSANCEVKYNSSPDSIKEMFSNFDQSLNHTIPVYPA